MAFCTSILDALRNGSRTRSKSTPINSQRNTSGLSTTCSPCQTYSLRRDRESKRLVLTPALRKCLFLYFYFVDREFGLMHVRLQTWLPMSIQVCLNGREYLARRLDKVAMVMAAASLVSNKINTAFVERQNRTDRNRNGWKTRKTYCFSKDWNVHDAVTYFTMYTYNFCWPVHTLWQRGHDGQ